MTALPPIVCPITNSKLPLAAEERELTYRKDFSTPPPSFVPARPVTPPTCAISKLPKLGTTDYESSFQSAYGSSGTGGDRAEIAQHNVYITNFKLEKCNSSNPQTTSHRMHFTAKSPIFKNNICYRKKQNVPQLPANQSKSPFSQETEYEKAFGIKETSLSDIDEGDDDTGQSECRRIQQLTRDPIKGE